MSTNGEPSGARQDTVNAREDAGARRGGPQELSHRRGVPAHMGRSSVIGRRRSVALIGTGILAAAMAAGASGSASGRPAARTARVLSVRDEGRLHFTKSSGEVIIDEGRASGSFPGWIRARFLYNGEPTVTAHFTISGAGGSISARGSGRLSSPTSPSPSFHGTMSVTGGTGRYAHIHGGGELYGVYYRRSYALTVQAIGKLPY